MDRQQARELAGFWAARRFAIAWTQSKDGDGAKRVTTKGWPEKAELYADDDVSAGLISGRIDRKNPCVVARKSGLILIDCDSEDDVGAFKAFKPPKTLAATTGKGRHFYYRPDDDCDEYRGVYFEAGKVTPKGDCYLVTPPALHPSGRHYAWDNDEEIAVLPKATYRAMLAAAGVNDSGHKVREALPDDAKIPEGQRHDALISLAGRLRRDGVPFDEAFVACMGLNSRFEKPKSGKEVRGVLERAYEKYEEVLPQAPQGGEPARPAEATAFDFTGTFVTAEDVESKHVKWLDKPFLLGAAFQILAAKGSTGKGLWTAHVAAQMTRGLLPGQDGPQAIAFVSSEDDAGQDWKPRLQAADADLSRCLLVTRRFRLPDDLAWLRAFIRHHELGAVIIDPVANHIGGADGNDEAAIRDALEELNKIAPQEECLILGVRHMRKDADSGALAAVLGSTAWVDLPRNVIVMVRDPEDTSVVYQDVLKQNRAAMGDSGRVYQIDGVDLVLDDGVEDNIGRMTPALDIEFRDLDSIVGKRKNTARKAIEDTILALLRSAPGFEMFANELDTAVVARVGCAEKTVKNARSGLTAEYKKPATEDRPLVTIKPDQSNRDQRYRVKLEWRTDLDKGPDEW
jgi:hypothetical protein